VADNTKVVTTIRDGWFFPEKYITNNKTTLLCVQNLSSAVDLMVKRLIFK